VTWGAALTAQPRVFTSRAIGPRLLRIDNILIKHKLFLRFAALDYPVSG